MDTFSIFASVANAVLGDGDDSDPELPPGSPPTYKFEGPWFTTQVLLSLSIGVTSFLLFSYCRTRWPLLFAPRTKLKGFSPHEAHAHQAFFGWIMPTLRVSEYTVLQIVGLDAAVLLNFFKMSFYLFSLCSVFAVAILMPMNWKVSTHPLPPSHDWLDLISDANSYLTVHFLFTYLFTFLALRFIYKNYRRFIRSRQLYSLELVHSIPARTVMVTRLPNHLQSERTLAEYFENMGLSVESVTVCREVDTLKRLIDLRTQALLKMESAWTKYVGNPSTVESYDPSENVMPPLSDVEPSFVENQPSRFVVPHRQRPTIRPGWFSKKVDALEYLEMKFKEADEKVKKWRRTGRFKATHIAFITFEKMSSAQIAVQTANAPDPFECKACAAPEPRDIIWSNMSLQPNASVARELIVLGCMALLLFFWIFPITALASLLSYKEIQKSLPWLGRLIDSNDKIRAIVQNSLPSVVMITLNALLPFILEALTYVQGYRARSWIEYSLMRKYFLFLLVNVVFIFLLASTYWQLVQDLANSPAKIPEKLAEALSQGRARHFFLSYVILQGLGIMPLQLLNLGIVLPRLILRIFFTRTPRDFAELNAPPMVNYGVVYPQAILMFVITLLYSVVQPMIVIFGAIYFGMAYVVYKYKLLFVFYKPYESQGQAWPLTFIRLIWGILIFLVFMTGIFILRKSYVLSSLLAPLILGTLLWSWYIDKTFKPLSKFVCLSSVFEVERGEETADVARLREGHPVTWSQSNLNRRRYGQNDETLYVAPEDERTDYSQPPMANWYSGVLNTGKRRYGHPALTGVLPEPWLPLKKGQTLVNALRVGGVRAPQDPTQGIVLTLRKRYSLLRGKARSSVVEPRLVDDEIPAEPASPVGENGHGGFSSDNPWDDARPELVQSQSSLNHRLSFDPASGVIMLPEDDDWLGEEDDSDEDYGHQMGRSQQDVAGVPQDVTSSSPSTPLITTPKRRYGTYYHHPERRRQTIPGAFPQPSA
ncbi:hypothetical protein SERLA73DRAFT_169572 [Serpula lacrymans var. lacrymans S7.3]|uniref:DUF221-domain-containing protein n=2 Tax=Serpula lacrymans var. lacrymans TaxID=341189 RepID=F8Q1S4_SERL3|nr:uncharacterized protein SERLADRAFT_450493 [Serpula lacrymans var. lacrymans S7.9]EGN97135.1 hypothetical protein SERLA73DRAFT_169572 [Serpula lacrymans var. lacrymans S7.3]EGO22744.1 hypothetical protein SERLADRAFT_450493 [Serpula lacrymans var. lacrymans S7.9]